MGRKRKQLKHTEEGSSIAKIRQDNFIQHSVRQTSLVLRMMCYSVMTQAYSEKEIPSSPDRSQTPTTFRSTTELQETRGN